MKLFLLITIPAVLLFGVGTLLFSYYRFNLPSITSECCSNLGIGCNNKPKIASYPSTFNGLSINAFSEGVVRENSTIRLEDVYNSAENKVEQTLANNLGLNNTTAKYVVLTLAVFSTCALDDIYDINTNTSVSKIAKVKKRFTTEQKKIRRLFLAETVREVITRLDPFYYLELPYVIEKPNIFLPASQIDVLRKRTDDYLERYPDSPSNFSQIVPNTTHPVALFVLYGCQFCLENIGIID